jgi:hypothetical protein
MTLRGLKIKMECNNCMTYNIIEKNFIIKYQKLHNPRRHYIDLVKNTWDKDTY